MIDILLMVPLPYFLNFSPNIPDLGLGYIASAVRNNGFSVNILDWNCGITADEFKEYLLHYKPKLIGIKVFTTNIKAAAETIKIIKSTVPDTIIVIGGPHPSTSEYDTIFEEFPQIDFAFKGEVETSFPKFLNLLTSISFDRMQINKVKKDFESVAGLIWSDNNEIKYTPPILEDISSFPLPAWDLTNPNEYFHPPLVPINGGNPHIAPIIVTRGCPFDCTFCSAYNINGKFVRRRKIEDVINEIEVLYHKYNIKQILIMDTSFMLDAEYVYAFCDEIIKKQIEIKWDCIYDVMANYTDVNVDVLLEIMHKAGCYKLNLGIETASPKINKVVKKDIDLSKISEIIALAKKHTIKLMGFFMFGFPKETLDDVKKTISYALAQPFDEVFFNICLPLPGSDIYYDLKSKYNFRRIDWVNYKVSKPPYQIGEVSPSVLNRMVSIANLKGNMKCRKGLKKYISKDNVRLVAKIILNK